MLRPYQYDLVSQVRDALPGHRSVLLQLETGAGKSIIAGTLAAEYALRGIQSLYLVHRRELVEQTVTTLNEFGFGNQVGILAAGTAISPWAPLQVGMIQSVSQWIGKLPWLHPEFITYDEAHHIVAASWKRVMASFDQAYNLGMTATPSRLDGQGMGDCFDVLIEGPPSDGLVAVGALCELDMRHVDVGLDLSDVAIRHGEYHAKQADARVTGPVIAAGVESVLNYAADRRLIHFAHSIRHSQAFADKLTAAGIRCEHVDGTMPYHQRAGILRRYRVGSTQALSNVALVDEGFNVPECDCVVLGRKTASLVRYRQWAGRTRRPKQDGRNGLLVDLAGNVGLHGRPDYPIEWTLEGGATEASVRKARADYKICEHCGFINPATAPACAACGYVREGPVPTEVQVELTEHLGGKQGRTHQIRRAMNERIFASGGDEAALRQIAREHGLPAAQVARWRKVWGPVWRQAG